MSKINWQKFAEDVEKDAEKLQRLIDEKWCHPNLANIWAILQMPDWDEDGPILRENDLNKISGLLIDFNEIANQPEVKTAIELGAIKKARE